ncbi:DUF166 domain-containing protein [Chloroflexota bacterium]
MRILALAQGYYGNRIVEHLRKWIPQGWTIEVITIPYGLPAVIDEPEEFLPSNIVLTDLLLAMTESPGASQLIPAIVGLSETKSVIAPIDNSAWLPPGLKNQLQQELAEMGVTAVFPKTFCTLTESSAGFRWRAEPHNDERIAAFARRFGQPKLRIKVDPQSKTIAEVMVERGAPCGSTHHIATELVGMPVEEVVPSAGLIAHHYPCLASMQREQLDDCLFDTLMHISGYVVNEDVKREIRTFL